MYPPPALYTSEVEYLGSTVGIVVIAVVALLGLAIFIGLVYWADSHPDPRIEEKHRRRREQAISTYTQAPEEVPRGSA